MLDDVYGHIPPGTLAAVTIHTNGAYGDSAWQIARSSYYGISGTPTMWFDGAQSVVGAGSTASAYAAYRAAYNTRRSVATDVTIQLGGRLISGQTYEVTAKIGIESGGTAKTMRVFIVQVLDDWPNPPVHTPRYGFVQAARPHGSEDQVTISPGQFGSITRNFTFTGDSWTHKNDIKIVAWAAPQSLSSKTVYQASVMHWPFTPLLVMGDMDGDLQVTLDDIDDFALALVDPAGYQALHPDLDPVELGDANEDGLLNGLDIEPFIALLGVDGLPPTPDPMTFAVLPAPNGTTPTTAIDMVATLATDATPPVQYAFETDTGPEYPGAAPRDWGMGRTYSNSGLTPNTLYVYRVKARDGMLLENTPSADASAATHIETPAGVAFGTITQNAIDLTASGTLTNLTLGQSGVYFDSTTTGGDGGINQWVQITTDTATGLSPNTSYTFRVKARNQNGVETVYGPTAAKYTLANTPAAPTLSDATQTALNLDVNSGGNPAATTFAVQCVATDPADANWVGMFVSVAGSPSATEVWQTDAAWGTVVVAGLQPNTAYTFAVKARNGDSVETEFGATATLSTTP